MKNVGKVKIGALSYDVVEDDEFKNDDGEYCYGETSHHSQEITLWTKLAPQAKFVTLWEEIIHGILVNAGYNGQHDERLVSALAHGVAQVVIDNAENDLIKPWANIRKD